MTGEAAFDTTPGALTPYRALDEVLLAHARSLRRALGDTVIGLYPIGSLAIGDFDLTSDVDFLVVTHHELAADEVERVQAAHVRLLATGGRWVRHLEYSVFPLPALLEKSSPYGPDGRIHSESRQLWYFPNGGAVIERSDHDNTLVTRWTLRYRSRPVLGPSPETFAPDVSARELRREIRSSMLGWQHLFGPGTPFDNRFHQVFFVLNNCRALQDLHEGRITSKRDGVAWALEHLDVEWQDLIRFCWREREDTGISVSQPADRAAVHRTVEFLAYTTRLAAVFPSRQG